MASPAVSPDSSSHEGLSSVNSAPACSPTSDSENLSPDELELLAKLEEQNRSVLAALGPGWGFFFTYFP